MAQVHMTMFILLAEWHSKIQSWCWFWWQEETTKFCENPSIYGHDTT